MVRSSTQLGADKDIKSVCADLQQHARLALENFGRKWDGKYRKIRPIWEAAWLELMAFMDFNEHIRRMVYTTSPVETWHRVLPKATKAKGVFVSEDAFQSKQKN